MRDSTAHRGHVLITGCSSGIGRACATYLAGRGFNVLACARNARDLPDGKGIFPVCLDVTNSESIRAAVASVNEVVGGEGLKGLVNNAGISVLGPVELVPLDDWRRQFEVNLFGQIAVTQAMLPLLRAHVASHGDWSARIINISSIAGRLAHPVMSPYCASKFALEAVSDALRRELNPQRIHVSSIQPGAVQSEIWNKADTQVAEFSPSDSDRQRYGWIIDGMVRIEKNAAATAIPATRVARAVEKCLTRRTPPARLLVGNDARLGAICSSLLPTRWFDAGFLGFIRKSARIAQASASTSRTI